MFYSDHGSPGVLGMPTGNLLYADQLLGAIRRKHAKGGYKEVRSPRASKDVCLNTIVGWSGLQASCPLRVCTCGRCSWLHSLIAVAWAGRDAACLSQLPQSHRQTGMLHASASCQLPQSHRQSSGML